MGAEHETAYFRGEGGSVFAMDLPLPEVMAEKLVKGYLRRVNEDGTPYAEPVENGGEDGEVTRPTQSAPKAEWVGYAVRHPDESRRMSPDDAEALTKQDLIDLFGKDG
ncbi:hypothetical protein E1287_37600 [Actinomadura sp. KC06]|uniref:hypothetical protein n=1 Tax=Actinomadura sp. KC06 TaxID=2530369 RepID=UPI00105044F6|nr:hypothetical protein [Actinomadura sp. KC06]TDD25050.1 hypothetical protein E1287_37600 [Actinomadura sp. KC06]